jgi:hypothetical protein
LPVENGNPLVLLLLLPNPKIFGFPIDIPKFVAGGVELTIEDEVIKGLFDVFVGPGLKKEEDPKGVVLGADDDENPGGFA